MMRIIFTLLIAACGAYLLYQAGVYINFIMARRPDGLESLTSDIPFLLRFVGTLMLLLGALIGLAGKRGVSRIMVTLGTLCFLLLTGAIIAVGGDVSLWLDEAVWSGVLLVLTAGIYKFR
ncbi:hypothetical protein [Ponticaulis sp.]|uniref:hypothetical protein n=1 Tax=Ponticaulis sp. TaxID=2020902 RepID=UPI000C5AA8CD|nr:hypothetical protein [Ponticaulis sp.]MBN02764.1 hypothetical protein [Ponticaulis sp.]